MMYWTLIHRQTTLRVIALLALAIAVYAEEDTKPRKDLVLGVSDTSFTLNGTKTFLLGASYYAALSIEDNASVDADLRDLARHGFNWIRVWATWECDDVNISAIARDGAIREPYMTRLLKLCAKANAFNMAVDITVTRNKQSAFPSTQQEHKAVLTQLATKLKPYRNLYFDVANERNIGDARHVSMDEVRELITTVKKIDPKRLCTASQGGDIENDEITSYLNTGKVDFLCPHRPREAASPRQTAAKTMAYLQFMASLPRKIPVLYQEPFRRGYSDWQPVAADFLEDLHNARQAGAAGWCWHNGSSRTSPDNRPRQSFDMRPREGRLFDQLDAEDRAFLDQLHKIKEHK